MKRVFGWAAVLALFGFVAGSASALQGVAGLGWHAELQDASKVNLQGDRIINMSTSAPAWVGASLGVSPLGTRTFFGAQVVGDNTQDGTGADCFYNLVNLSTGSELLGADNSTVNFPGFFNLTIDTQSTLGFGSANDLIAHNIECRLPRHNTSFGAHSIIAAYTTMF